MPPRFKKLKTQLDVITSASNIEEDLSDSSWTKEDYQDRFSKNYGEIRDYFSNHFDISYVNSDIISSDNESSITNLNTFKLPWDTMNTFTLNCKFVSLTSEFRKCLKKILEEPPKISFGHFFSTNSPLQRRYKDRANFKSVCESNDEAVDEHEYLSKREGLCLNRNRRSSDNKLNFQSDTLVPPIHNINKRAIRKGSATSRYQNIDQHKKRFFGIFGNILVKSHQREKYALQRQDSLNLEDDFVYALNDYKMGDASGMLAI